ncbi:MAG: CoA pyrophosphatase [Planctomycetota bacterium]
MTLPPYAEQIRTALATSADTQNPSRPQDRMAAVVLPLLGGSAPSFVGILRDDRGPHGGQFALPGGAADPTDANSWGTAVREMREEVGLGQEMLPLGQLGEYNTVISGYRVLVHVGFVPTSQSWTPQPGEVEAVLEIPIAQLLPDFAQMPQVDDVWTLPISNGFEFDAQRFVVAGELPPRGRGHRLRMQEREEEMPFIWGLTARILYDFLRLAWPHDSG